MTEKLVFRLFFSLFITTFSFLPHSVNADAPPKHEVRAVWLTTIGGIDWPHNYANTPSAAERQKQELRSILDKLQHANINTVLLQTRIRATAIFPTTQASGKEPWDGCLSGKPGKSPGYDALQFAIDECHARGMYIHAWVVTIPVGKWNSYGCRTLRERHGSLVMRIGDEGFMNPADTRTATYLADYCRDLARRYDLDGIHLDYIRYPETMRNMPKGDEGRRNITRIVRTIHDAVKKEKPWVRLSCSPIGKHDDTRRFWSSGWNARSRVCQDAKEWMRCGLMDMEFPMMYFKGKHFYPFVVDWHEGCYGREVVPGLGIYFLHPREKDWQLTDITRQLYVSRSLDMGFCLFRSKFFTDNTKGLYDFVSNHFCPYPALLRPLSSSFLPPSAPGCLVVSRSDKGVSLHWEGAFDRSNGDRLTYNVYASPAYPVDTDDARNLMLANISAGDVFVPHTSSPTGMMYYAVTATDRYCNESVARQEPATVKGSQKIVRPGSWWVTHPLGR